MKTLTKIELTVLAIAVFAANDSINQVFGTEDGQIFLDENRANLHAGTKDKKLKVYPISRGDAEQAAKKENKVKETPEAPKTPKQTLTPEKKEKKEAKKEASTAPTESTTETPGTEDGESGTTPEPTKEGTESETEK